MDPKQSKKNISEVVSALEAARDSLLAAAEMCAERTDLANELRKSAAYCLEQARLFQIVEKNS